MLPNFNVHILDTIIYHHGKPFQIIENSRGIERVEKGTVVTHSASDMSSLDVLKFFKQRSHELVGFKRKDGRLRDIIARVWVLETATTIISTTMNENSLRSCLDDNTDGIVAIQAFMGGWPARASGKFEHRYNIKYDTKKVLHETFELVNAVGGTGDLNGVEITVYTKEADRLAIMTGFQHECISKLTNDFVKHIQHRTGAGISSIAMHVEFDSAWHPHIVAARSIYFINAPAEFVIMKDSMIYPAGKGPANGSQGLGKIIKKPPERRPVTSERRTSTIGLVRGRGTFNNGNSGLLNMKQGQGALFGALKVADTTLNNDASSTSSSSSSSSENEENGSFKLKSESRSPPLSPPSSIPASPVASIKKVIAPTFDENYNDDNDEVPTISTDTGPTHRMRPLSSSMSRARNLHLLSTVTGKEFENEISSKNRFLALTESQRIRMSYNSSLIKMPDIGPFEPQIIKHRPSTAPTPGHQKKEKLGKHGLERGGKRSSGFWKRLERPSASHCWGDLCFLSGKAQFHHHSRDGKLDDLVTMRSIAYLRAEMKFLGGTFAGDEVEKAVDVFNLKRDNLVSYLGRVHLESIGEKVRAEIQRLHFGTLALTEMRNWDTIHSKYREWIYINLVKSLGLHKKSFYYTVPVCHCCMKMYTFLDTFRDQIVQYDIWPENKKKTKQKNQTNKLKANDENTINVADSIESQKEEIIIDSSTISVSAGRARSPSLRAPPSPNPLAYIEEEDEDLDTKSSDDFILGAKTTSLEVSDNFNSLEISGNINSLEISNNDNINIDINVDSNIDPNIVQSTRGSRRRARESAEKLAASQPPSIGKVLKARLHGRTALTLSAWTNLYDKKYPNKTKVVARNKNTNNNNKKVVEQPPSPMTLREKINKISKIYEQKTATKPKSKNRERLHPVNSYDEHNDNNSREQYQYYDNDNNNDNDNTNIQYNDNRYGNNINNNYYDDDEDDNDDVDNDNNNEIDTSINDYITYQSTTSSIRCWIKENPRLIR